MNEQQANQLFEQAIGALQTGQAAVAERILKKLDGAVPGNPGIIYYLGVTASLLGRREQAISLYDRVTRLHPQFVEAYNNKGLDLRQLGKLEESIKSFEKALQIRPDFVEAYLNLGSALNDAKRYEEALKQFSFALKIRPDFPDALTNTGQSLIKLGREQEALQALSKSVQINPKDAKAYHHLGRLHEGKKSYEEAIRAYNIALELNPLSDWTLGDLLHLQMKACQWHNYEDITERVIASINMQQKCIAPLALAGLPSSLETQRLCAEISTRSEISMPLAQLTKKTSQPNKKTKVAYLSSDFFNHATSYLMAELFELHDRTRFEIIGVCYSRSSSDEMRQRLTAGFDQFIEVANKSDKEVAELLQDIGVDIAIDLKGHTENNRLGILAHRPAPIQMHYLGYPGTLGTTFIDYLVADPVLIPHAHQNFYDEKIVYLPNSYQANDRKRKITILYDKRSDHGLPAQGFVYCCFNNNWKITPDIFKIWMNILKRVDGSVLWLLNDNELASKNLREEAISEGVPAERLVFAERLPLDQHLGRMKHADLFLDTLHCNAHTTASDALWAGLPVLTKIGETFATRVAASLLTSIDLPELIAKSLEDYESLAVDLASQPDKLHALKEKLSKNRLTSPLFDTPRFTKNFEAALLQAIARHQQGLSPDHIYVAP